MEFDDDYDGAADRDKGRKEGEFVLFDTEKMSWK
jgi:hypothetical protein